MLETKDSTDLSKHLRIEFLPADYFNQDEGSPLIMVHWGEENRVQTVEAFRELRKLDSIDNPLGAIVDVIPSEHHDAVIERIKRKCEEEGIWNV